MNLSVKKKIAAAATAATILGGAGIAFGYWTSTGTGSGSATAGAASDWVVTADSESTVALTPGGPAETVDFQVNNPSTGNQGLQAVAISVANSDGSTWTSGDCDADDFSVGGEAVAGSTHTITYTPVENVGPGDTFVDDVTVAMVNKADANQDDCKDVTVPLYLSAS